VHDAQGGTAIAKAMTAHGPENTQLAIPAHALGKEVGENNMGRHASERRELRALRQAFGQQLPERVRAIEKALEDTLDAVPVDRDRAEIVFQLTHRLCGAASIYGYSRVYEAATALECVAEALRDSQPANTQGHAAHARRLMKTLKRAAGLPAVAESHRLQKAGETLP